MDHTSYSRGFFCSKRFFIPAIIVMILTVQQSCVLGYEEIIGFNQNFTSSFDDCSRIVWYPDMSEGHNSPPAFRSGPIRNSGLSCISKIVYGPANINFFWKVAPGRDRIGELSFNVDNEPIMFCQSSEWSPAYYAISPGRHLLSWVYKKQYSYPEFFGAGWIDDIEIINKNGTPQILTEPENHVFEQELTLIERNISLIQEQLTSFDSRQNISRNVIYQELALLNTNISMIEDKLESFSNPGNMTKEIINPQLASIKNNISMIEDGLDFIDLLRNVTDDIVFINNDRNVTLTNKLNKYKNKMIILGDGVYYTDGLVINNTNNIYIRPIIMWNTTLDGNGASRGIEINNSNNVTIDSLVINNSSCNIRILNCQGITITNNLIKNYKTFGIRISNSSNCRIDSNRFSTNYCENIHDINISTGSYDNVVLANIISLGLCNSSRRISYCLNNSYGNFIQTQNVGYIKDNGIKCRMIYKKYSCEYVKNAIPADLAKSSANVWSFLAYDPIN
jgi:parallel beta-helix repeat protein